MMTKEQYEEAHKDLLALSRSVDIWKQTPQTKAQQKKVGEILENLQAESFQLECAFLEKKLAAFKQILAVLKNEA